MTLLSAFNPHELPEDVVRAVATGRDSDLADIIATVRTNLDRQTLQHLLVSAPRGFGKSFLMRHVQLELQRITRTESLPVCVVLMPEELPHVREPHTLIRELARTVRGRSGSETELSWHEDDQEWDLAVADLHLAIDEVAGPGGMMVALVENFDLLLRQAFSANKASASLRALLTRRGARLMLVAASASGAVDHDYDKPLFKAFRDMPLRPWTSEECLTFFDRQHERAGRPPLADDRRARAKAITAFIGGTPRLATLLGEALLDDNILYAADMLGRMIDELTPYYKHRIETLPGRSQKLLDALLRFGEPATPSELARRVKARSQSDIAEALRVLAREQMVVATKATGSASKLYRAADRIFAFYYRKRISAHDQALCPLEALSELMAAGYSNQRLMGWAKEWGELGLHSEAEVAGGILAQRMRQLIDVLASLIQSVRAEVEPGHGFRNASKSKSVLEINLSDIRPMNMQQLFVQSEVPGSLAPFFIGVYEVFLHIFHGFELRHVFGLSSIDDGWNLDELEMSVHEYNLITDKINYGILSGVVLGALSFSSDSEMLQAVADQILLARDTSAADSVEALQMAAAYHSRGRDPSAIERMDPDLAQTLMTRFPPEQEISDTDVARLLEAPSEGMSDQPQRPKSGR